MRFLCSCGAAFDTRRRLSIHIAGNKWEHYEDGRLTKKSKPIFTKPLSLKKLEKVS